MLDAWASGEPQTRQGLLREVFEALDVDGGLIGAYVPRSVRAAEVVSLFGNTWQLAVREGFGSPATKRGAIFS